MSRKEMDFLNPDVNIDQLDPGQKITILAPPSRKYANPYTSSASITDIGQVAVNVYKKSLKKQIPPALVSYIILTISPLHMLVFG